MSDEKNFEEEKPGLEDYDAGAAYRRSSIGETSKSQSQRIWPAFAAGAGLFSDGYLQVSTPKCKAFTSDREFCHHVYPKSRDYDLATKVASGKITTANLPCSL